MKTKQHLRDFLVGVQGFLRQNRKTVVGALCLVVAFWTIAALSLPAVTLNDTVYCGQEEHAHTEDCYETVLVCGYEKGEADGHVHDANCYQTETVLICGLDEGDETGHEHSESCFEERTTLICGQEETGTEGGHVHTGACYETRLACGKTAHTHSLACHSNPEADTETADDWKKSLSAAELTGDWAADLLSVAETQLGYTESTENYQVQDDGVTLSGYTRYGAWNGTPYADWNATFVNFCLNYAGISAETMPVSTACESWVAMLSGEQAGYEDFDLFQAAGMYIPEPGDLIFFDTDADGEADRVGIVTAYTEASDVPAEEISGETSEESSEAGSGASSGVTPEVSSEFTWSGLDDGDYKLVETTTPSGYNEMADQYFTITAIHTTLSEDPKLENLSAETTSETEHIVIQNFNPDPDAGTLSVTIENKKGTSLPSTGGIGTTIFYVVGGVLAVGAAILLIVKRRMNGYQD